MAGLAPIVFVSFPSLNSASVQWPSTNEPPLTVANQDIIGVNTSFTLADTVQTVFDVASRTNFFGVSSQSGIDYNRMFKSTFNSVTNKYGFQLVASSTTLGAAVETTVPGGSNQFWISSAGLSGVMADLNVLNQTIVATLNGPKDSQGSLYDCPCSNEDQQFNFCGLGAWNFLTRLINIEMPDKTRTWLAPCCDPGKTMVVEGGLGNFVKATVQVKRIRNFDRLRFRSVNAQVKPCNKSLLFTINAETCPAITTDNFSSTVFTKLGLDFSVQASVLGTNVFDTGKRFCDALPSVTQFQTCSNASAQCLEVFVPSALVNMQLEVPVQEYAGPTAMSTVTKADLDFWCGLFNSGKKGYTTKFGDSTLTMDFALLDKPTINFPGPTIINEDLKFVIETAIMQAANTSLRSVLSKQVSDQLAPFLIDALEIGQVVDGIPLCLNFSQTFDSMTCVANSVPTPPGQCNPCDFCCLCLAGGDCGEKCLQNCPCVIPFCTQVDRIFDPFYWIIFGVIVILIVFFMLVGGGFLRGLMPRKF